MKRFIGSLVLFSVSAVAIICIPMTQGLNTNQQALANIILGGIFWGGFLFGIVCLNLVKLKQSEKIPFSNMKVWERIKRAGCFRFFSSRQSGIVFVLACLGILLHIINVFYPMLTSKLFFMTLGVTYYCFILHCVLDGAIYQIYIKNKGEGRYVFEE